MNRLWRRSSVLLLCLAQFVAASTFSQAADKTAGEVLFPKDTLVFFTISNIPEFKQKWDKCSMGQLLRDPQLKPFLEDVEKKIDESSKQMENEVGVSLTELLELPKGELTIAVIEKPARKLSVILSLDFGDSKATMDKLLKKMDEALEKEGAEHSTEDVNKVSVHVYTLKNPEQDNPFKTITYFTTDSHLVLSSEMDAIKEVLERWDGSSDDSLAQNDQFKYIQSQCKFESGEPLVKWYVNPIGLIQSGISMAQATIPQAGMVGAFLPMFGVDGWKGWGGAVDLDEGEFEMAANSFIYAENPRGVMGLFQFPAAQLAPPKWVPADIGSYMVANWNVLGAYTSVETLVDSFQGRGATARFLDSVAEQGPMIHPKKDVIENMDGKIHVLQADPKEGEDEAPPTPQVLVGFGLKDAAKMKKTLAAAAKEGNSNLETREFNGETIYEVSSPNGDQAMSMVVTEGHLILTNDIPLLEGMMRGQTERTSLVDSDDYKRVSKFFPSKTSMLSFQRGDAQLKTYYNMLKNADNFVDGIDVSKLPPFEVISKYLQPSGGYTVPDKKGAKSITFSLKRSE
jgi:hypothetical protein